MALRNLPSVRIGFVALIAAACGIDATGLMTSPNDAAPDGVGRAAANDDGATPDSQSEAQPGDDAAFDGDALAVDAAVDSALDTGVDAGFMYECPGVGDVSSCASCSGRPTSCVFCSNTNTAQLRGLCLQSSQACYYNTPSGYDVCRCTNDVSQCPTIGVQVCNSFDNGYCQPCGDQYSDGFPCRTAGTCDRASGTCQ